VNVANQWHLDADDGVVRSIKRQIRLIVLLDAAEGAGLVPLGVVRLHAFAYLSNVLAPVWDMEPLDGKLLKRQGSPFYPDLQGDLDRLVGLGVAMISGLGHVLENGRWRLEGRFRLHRRFADPIIAQLAEYDDERRLATFIQELAFAISAFSDDDLDSAVSEDATYSDSLVMPGSVIDFDEWRHVNYSANAAQYFDYVLPDAGNSTPGEKLHLYVRHLQRRVHDGS
jgi:hypothetical protein